jgi:hypothetical protein
MPSNEQLRRTFIWTGGAGAFGAIVFLVGDALLYLTNSGERDFVGIMAQIPLSRVYYGGALGIVASWFYTLGSWQVYRAVQPAGGRLAGGAFAAFAAMTIGMGSFHVAYAGLGLIGRTTRIAQLDAVTTQQALDQGWGYIAILVQLLTATAVTFTAFFIFAVLSGRTWYPRWFFVLTPGFLPLLYPTVDRLANATLPSTAYLTVSGSFYNVGMLFFFVASTLVLSKRVRHADV